MMGRTLCIFTFIFFIRFAAAQDTSAINHLLRSAFTALRGNLDSSLAHASRAFELSRRQHYEEGALRALFIQAQAYYYLHDHTKALDKFLDVCRTGEKNKAGSELAESYYFIGKIHRQLGNYEKALQYARLGLALSNAVNDQRLVSASLNGIGNIYAEQSRFDSALYYYKVRLRLEKEKGNPESVAAVYGNVALTFSSMNKLDSALYFYEEGLKIIDSSPLLATDRNFRKFKGTMLAELGAAYLKKNETAKAEKYAEESLAIVEADSARREMIAALQLLSEISRKKGDAGKALQYMERYTALKDALFRLENSAKFAEMQTRFETEKKEQQLKIQELEITEEKERSKKVMIISVCALIVLLCTGLVIWYRNRTRQKALLEETLRQQQKLRYTAVMEASEKERTRIAGELHDGLGQLLATARINLTGVEDDNDAETNRNFISTSLNLLDMAASEVRSISHSMAPKALVKSGFFPAVEQLVNAINSAGKVNVNYTPPAGTLPVLPENVQVHGFRILQELFSNTLKHSGAAAIQLTIAAGAQLEIDFRDNGKGFDTKNMEQHAGIGWKNIFSRIEFLNGKIHLSSEIGKGATIRIKIPLTV